MTHENARIRPIAAARATAGLLGAVLLSAAAFGSVESAPAPALTVAAPEEPGTKILVTGTVVDGAGHAIAGAELHVYQTDASGAYTRERAMDEGHARLSGYVHTDAAGRFELRTIRPGGYPKALRLGDRERKIPAHIHIDVGASGFVPRQLQAVFADDPLLADPYWQDWVKSQRHPVLTARGAADGAPSAPSATLEIVLERAP